MLRFLFFSLFFLKQALANNINLTVEGAQIRPFRLWFSLKETKAPLNQAQKDIWSNLSSIIKKDLEFSGNFTFIDPNNINKNNEELLKQLGVEGFSKIDINFVKSELIVTIHNKNLITNKNDLAKVKDNLLNYRKLAHKIAKNIFNEFIGEENLFLLEIAAIKKDKNVSQIVMFDFDGANEKIITEGKNLKSSPSFSSNGKSILYTIIQPDGQAIVEQEIGNKKYNIISKKNGLNIDAKVSPDNKFILATLSLGKNADIYKLDRKGNVLHKMTESLGQNLSPSISGDEMVFVSNRSGNPQVYLSNIKDIKEPTKEAIRLTFQGNYNQTPALSPDGKLVAFTGRDEKKVFDIFILERSSGKIHRLTENQGRNQEPIFTSSGRYLIFSSERNRHKAELYLSSLNGKHQVRLTHGGGYYSPTLRPLQL